MPDHLVMVRSRKGGVMLQQILKDMYIDPELLAELPEDQKQYLFDKMREEQVRRWFIREKEEEAKEKEKKSEECKPRKNGKKVDFMTGSDGNDWVWVMGEHPDDKSIEQILEEEAECKAIEQAEREIRKEMEETQKERKGSKIATEAEDSPEKKEEEEEIIDDAGGKEREAIDEEEEETQENIQATKEVGTDENEKGKIEAKEEKEKKEEVVKKFVDEEGKQENEERKNIKEEEEENERKKKEEEKENRRKEKEEKEMDEKEAIDEPIETKAEEEEKSQENIQATEEVETDKNVKGKIEAKEEKEEKEEVVKKFADEEGKQENEERKNIKEEEEENKRKKKEEEKEIRRKEKEEEKENRRKEKKKENEEKKKAKEEEKENRRKEKEEEKESKRRKKEEEKVAKKDSTENGKAEKEQREETEGVKLRKKAPVSEEEQLRKLIMRRSREILFDFKSVRARFEQLARTDAKEVKRHWRKQEEKARAVEAEIRQERQRVRAEQAQKPEPEALFNLQLMQAVPAGAPMDESPAKPPKPPRPSPRGAALPTSPAPPLPPRPRVTRRPASRQAALLWFLRNQKPRGAGVDPSNRAPAAWFHGLISRAEAESRLEEEPEGAFLIRISERLFGYAVSVRDRFRCKHFLVEALESGYRLFGLGEHRVHATLRDFVDFHARHPLTAIGNERLLTPLSQSFDSPTEQDAFYVEFFPERPSEDLASNL